MQELAVKELQNQTGKYNLSAITVGQTLLGDFVVGSKHIKVDGPNTRIMFSDDDDIDNMLMGRQDNGF